MSGIEENTQHVEYEKGKDCRPESILLSPTPKSIEVDRKIDSGEKKGLHQPFVPIVIFANPWEPSLNDNDGAEYHQAD